MDSSHKVIDNAKSNSKGVIVMGGHVQGLGIIRIFGKKGIPSILIDETRYNIARHSKYCSGFYESRNILDTLQKFISENKYLHWILIPTNDSQVEILSKNKESISKHFFVASDRWEILKSCYNKRETYRIAKELGLNFPKSMFPDSPQELLDIQIEYPCIIKPAVMHSFYKAFKKKVFVCNSKEELIQYYNLSLKVIPANEIIIQEIIPGIPENQYSVCYYYEKNEPLVTLCARRKRQHPLDFGNATTYAETVNIPEILDASNQFLGKIEYTGICEVEFKFDERDQSYKLLEINPRTWKWHYISELSESPFLLTLFDRSNNHKVNPVNTWKEASWQHFITDYVVVLKQLLNGTFRSRNNKSRIIQAVLDKKDIMPFIFELIYLPFLIKSR